MEIILYFCIAIIALLYSAVGHGGATGYLAVMSIWGIEPDLMASVALILNCLTATISCTAYSRKGFISVKLIFPFLLTSIPFAFIGAKANLDESQFLWILAVVLIISSVKLCLYKSPEESEKFENSPNLLVALSTGSILGFLAGAIGIGGGVFLSPVIILLGWADPKTTSGCAALFIVLNSFAGLLARAFDNRIVVDDIWPYLLFALFGALAGSIYGSKHSSSSVLRKLIAVVLLLAVARMFLSR